jgi:flagellar motor switch protein FliG
MPLAKKLNLTRFKKSQQGLIEFATLIEQADPQSRTRIMEQAEQQDGEFLRKVMKRVVFFDELVYIEETILAEILSKTSSKVLAYALHEMGEDFNTKLLKQVGHRELKQYHDEKEKMGSEISQGLVLGARKQILKNARVLEAQNKFSFELSSCPRFNGPSAKPRHLRLVK